MDAQAEAIKSGKYLQFLPTHKSAPADGSGKNADNLDAKPTDQADSWSSKSISIPQTSKASYRVDTYESPQGKGYMIVTSVLVGREHWIKCVNVGPEESRDTDWFNSGADG